jgi:hypothetical protein
MRPHGVGTVLAAALLLSLVTAATAGAAAAPPECWKGRAGCTHTALPHWDVRSFGGTVSVVGTRRATLTCADVANGPREEIVAGRYTVRFSMRRDLSDLRVPANARKLPTTSKPLDVTLRVTSVTHERVRTLDPNGCKESFRDCDTSRTGLVADRLEVYVRGRRVIQESPGDFIPARFLECAETATTTSLLPDDPLDGKLVSEDSSPAAFRHRSTVVPIGRDRQVGDGNTSVTVSGRLTYARTIHACTRYPRTKPRCRDARG